MIDIVQNILLGIMRIISSVAIGSFIGVAIDELDLLKYTNRFIEPVRKFSGLSLSGASSFILAFASPRVANTMLVGTFDNGEITEREMIKVALMNSFPNVVIHMRVLIFMLTVLLGYPGAVYCTVQIIGGLITFLIASVFIKVKDLDNRTKINNQNINDKKNKDIFIKRVWIRSYKMVKRIILISLPFYIIIATANELGLFSYLAKLLPYSISSKLPAESVAIVGAHFSGINSAAVVAKTFSETLGSITILKTLLVGYILTTPIRVIRHTMPAYLGIFPKNTTFKILGISVGVRMVTAILLLVILVMIK